MQPLISIIVTAYNIAPYISRCLDSILCQTYEHIEIIVVDDGSIDGTGSIVDDYVDQYTNKVRCFHVPNAGVTNARLLGVESAKGEWIGFVDGDDEIEQDMYERLIKNALEYRADISHCGYKTIVNEGERIHYFYNTGKIVVQDKISGLIDLLEGKFIEPGLWNKLFRKELFYEIMNNDVMDRSIKHNEDLLMNYLLFSESKVAVYEDFCPYHYMTRSDSATRIQMNKNKIYDPIKVATLILEKSVPMVKGSAKKRYLKVNINAYEILCMYSNIKQEAKKIRKDLLSFKTDWILLNSSNRIKVVLICYFPLLYKLLIKIYIRYFQKKIYE